MNRNLLGLAPGRPPPPAKRTAILQAEFALNTPKQSFVFCNACIITQ